jgi:hypothetical protein
VSYNFELNLTAEIPESIDCVDRDTYDGIARISRPDTVVSLRRHGDVLRPLSYINPKVDGAIKMLVKYATDHMKQPLIGIDYTFDRSTVLPGVSQRPPVWHADLISDPIVVVSDKLPTEFVVAGEPGKVAEKERKRIFSLIKRSNKYFDLIDPAIESGLFQIYRPKEYEAVVMRKNVIHRSAKNLGEAAITKAFMRAALLTGR